MNELALFAGAGGGILGGTLLGWTTVCAVEIDTYAASILVQRQNDGILPLFPIWDDVCTFDGNPWRGIVDVISGGFPCQDISAAGKGAGITGERSGLWKEFARIIGEVRPRYVLVENSPILTSRGVDTVLGNLASMGYDAEWGVLGAVDAGAPHKRDRMWIVAYPSRTTRKEPERTGRTARNRIRNRSEISNPIGVYGHDSRHGTSEVCGERSEAAEIPERLADSDMPRRNAGRPSIALGREEINSMPRGIGQRRGGNSWWTTEPDVGRVAHGVAARVDRLKAIGNGQVPAVVALAWEILNELV